MEDSNSNSSKSRLAIPDDDSGLELSLGLSLGSKKHSEAPEAAVAAAAGAGVGPAAEDARAPPPSQFRLDAAKRKALENPQLSAMLQLQQAAVNHGLHWDVNVAQRLRQVMQEKGGFHLDDDAAWGQFSKQISGGAKGDLAKYVSSKASAFIASQQQQQQQHQQQHQHQQQQHHHQQQQQLGGDQVQDDDLVLDSSSSLEQQKRFNQHQEARKKRKMMIDEQKQQKKTDDKPDGPENVGIPPLQRATSLGNFQNLYNNNPTSSNPGAAVAAKQPSPEAAQQGTGGTEDPKSLLGSWQLGTTKDMPSAENIDPELSTVRPGMVAGQIGGTGSSPDLPWVSATGPGPNGKTITGVVYKLYQGQFKVVCACHGLHMSPAEFVKHAGQDASPPDSVKALGGPEAMSQHVTPA